MATASRRAGTTANVMGSVALTPHEERAHDAGQGGGAGEAEPDTGERHDQALPENQSHDIAPARTEGDTHANLTRPLLRRIRDRAVEAERRQAQRQDGERADERQQEPRLRHGVRDVRRERRQLGDRHVRVHGRRFGADARDQARRIRSRAHDVGQGQERVEDVRDVNCLAVLRGERCRPHVVDDADDPNGEPLIASPSFVLPLDSLIGGPFR
jgi:hypothetical protein